MNAQRTPVPAQYRDKITPNQRLFILKLLDERVLPPEATIGKVDSLMKSLRISEDPEEFGMGKSQASAVIDWLLKRPKKDSAPEQASGTSDVPDGYYALHDLEGYANDINFFRLNTGKKGGRWEGVQFITHVVAGGHDHPIKGTEGRGKVYDAIREQGQNEARMLYGQEIGRCGVCNRMLTDDTSRALGIGPVCAGREGW
jgi:hypothetical protein